MPLHQELMYRLLSLSDNGVAHVNEVTLHRARLVIGWVTVHGLENTILYLTKPPLLSLAIPPWVGAINTGDGLAYC